ncbi:MAG: class I SAM-dependent methyltransferase [Cytophagales bacterium]|nr:class I SAM-dependent methyltransferase [Cytophaga sp.]
MNANIKYVNVRKGYNRLARVYDLLASIFFFNRINKSQTALLPYVPDFERCLIIGGGSGYFLEKLLSQKSMGRIIYIDLSDVMIEKAQRRIAERMPLELHRIEFRCTSFDDNWNESFDLTVFNFFLDQFPEKVVAEILEKCNANLTNRGLLYITDFAIPVSNKFFNGLSKSLLKLLYRFFKMTTAIEADTLPDLPFLLSTNQFECIQSVSFWHGIMVSSLYQKRHPLTS